MGPIPLDPHEKVNMDAEKIMSNTWDFEFMVKKTWKKLARTTKFHITPLGPSLYICNIDISINLCQDFKKCQYFDKLMSIFRKNTIFQQIYVNISKTCQYFNKLMSIFRKNVPCLAMEERKGTSAPGPGSWLYIDIYYQSQMLHVYIYILELSGHASRGLNSNIM